MSVLKSDKVRFKEDLISKQAFGRKSITKLEKQFILTNSNENLDKQKDKQLPITREDSMKSSLISDSFSFINLKLHKVEEEDHSEDGDS